MLAAIEPVSRRGDWSDDIEIDGVDPDALEGASFAFSIYPQGCTPRARDYGFRRISDPAALAVLRTGTSALVRTGAILSFAYPPGTFRAFAPGPYEASLVMTLGGRASELLRIPFTVI